jgi:hypothetical protein
MMVGWSFLVLSFFFSSRLICCSISLQQRFLDSIASLFWREIALVSWLMANALPMITAPPAVVLVAAVTFEVMHCRCQLLQKVAILVLLGLT